jgi:hypothetical protein
MKRNPHAHATHTAEACHESARILDDARKGMVLGGQLPPRWPKRKMKTRNTRLAPNGGTP